VLAPGVTIKFVHARLGTIAAISKATLTISFFIVFILQIVYIYIYFSSYNFSSAKLILFYEYFPINSE